MRVTIARVNEVLFDGEAVSLTIPATGGEMTVLGGHMPLLTTLKQGVVVVRTKEGEQSEFPIDDGVLEVRRDGATVIL